MKGFAGRAAQFYAGGFTMLLMGITNVWVPLMLGVVCMGVWLYLDYREYCKTSHQHDPRNLTP